MKSNRKEISADNIANLPSWDGIKPGMSESIAPQGHDLEFQYVWDAIMILKARVQELEGILEMESRK